MVKQRETYRQVRTPEEQARIDNDQCPQCGKPKAEWTRRKDWRCCSWQCSDLYYKDRHTFDWSALRRKVIERDNFTCVKCGFTPPAKFNRWSCFIADHIKPIACGGDEWDMANIQTLCKPCNKVKTASDAKLIAIERKREKHKILL